MDEGGGVAVSAVSVVSALVPLRLLEALDALPSLGGGGGFFGRLTAPDELTVSVTTGPAVLVVVAFPSVVGARFGATLVVPVVIALPVSSAGAVVVAALVSLTVDVVSLLLVVFVLPDC